MDKCQSNKEREPYATEEEYKKIVFRFEDIPPIPVGPDGKSQLITTDKITVEDVHMNPGAFLANHRHEGEQVMMILEGAIDEIVEGKLYHLEAGDNIVVPSNAEHGLYTSEKGCHFMVATAPARFDLLEIQNKVKKELGLI